MLNVKRIKVGNWQNRYVISEEAPFHAKYLRKNKTGFHDLLILMQVFSKRLLLQKNPSVKSKKLDN